MNPTTVITRDDESTEIEALTDRELEAVLEALSQVLREDQLLRVRLWSAGL